VNTAVLSRRGRHEFNGPDTVFEIGRGRALLHETSCVVLKGFQRPRKNQERREKDINPRSPKSPHQRELCYGQRGAAI